jgi:hypothetical protein
MNIQSTVIPFILIAILCGCSAKSDKVLEIPVPTSDNSQFPRLTSDNTGTVFMSWYEHEKEIASLKFSTFKQSKWTTPKEIASGEEWFINWADFPSIIAIDGKPMAAHWLNKVEGGTYAYEINMSIFDDDWGPAFTPHFDNTSTEHGFVSMTPISNNSFISVWLDGRRTENRSDNEYTDMSKAMTLRAALIDTSGSVLQKYLLDDTVCDCCNTAITKTNSGYLVAYRNRTKNEIRDIYTVSIQNDGSVSNPKVVNNDNWKMPACPVNGPALASYGDEVGLAWFTAAGNNRAVKLALSSDGGLTFAEPFLLDDETPIGRVDIAFTKEKIWVSWLQTIAGQEVLNLSSYNKNGEFLDEIIIDEVSGSRETGFPQIATVKKRILVAFTSLGAKNNYRIRTILVEE